MKVQHPLTLLGLAAGLALFGTATVLVGGMPVANAGNTPGSGIGNSPHDFSAASWTTSTDQICIVCHTPHNANTGASGAPLWNRRLTVANFTLYSSDTFNANGTIGQPDGVSKLCLSCHDGTVGLESFGSGNASMNVWTDPASGATNIDAGHLVGTNLSNDHPISFTYDTSLASADGGLKNPANEISPLPLFSGKLQCATCHDVHNSLNKTLGAPLLRVDNAGSALCLKCHNK